MTLKTKIGKATLSAFLRTNCDRELYLSLFRSNTAERLLKDGMPAPLSGRAHLQLMAQAGIQFEADEYKMLQKLMGNNYLRYKEEINKEGEKKYADLDLAAALADAPVPGFCLQPYVDPQLFRKSFFCDDLQLTPQQEKLIPELTGLRPDLIITRHRAGLIWEVMPDGKRKMLDEHDSRTALSVVDMKSAAEANRSYAAEVVLYALFLSKWVIDNGWSSRYFVSDECFLWTNTEKTALEALRYEDIDKKLEVLLSTLEKVEFVVIVPCVVKFFAQDVLRVLEKAKAGGWQSIDFHVDRRCSSCDWLGYEDWLATEDKKEFNKNPEWYCVKAAAKADHLSRLPDMSRGARKILENHNIRTIADLSNLSCEDEVLKKHSFLKRDRHNIVHRAQAIATLQPSTDNTAALSGLAKSVELIVSVAVGFDTTAGRLTGIAIHASFFKPRPKPLKNSTSIPVDDTNLTDEDESQVEEDPNPIDENTDPDENRNFSETEEASENQNISSVKELANLSVVVENDTAESEWDALIIFFEKLIEVKQKADEAIKKHWEENPGSRTTKKPPVGPETQLWFWDKRSFDALCAALGRHLPRILALSPNRGKKSKGEDAGAQEPYIKPLAWIFPPEELMETEGAVAPYIVFIGELARRVLRTTTPHAFTLHNAFHDQRLLKSAPVWKADNYFVEPLGSGIPRERIFEVWRNQGTISRGRNRKTKSMAASDYGKALEDHTRAIDAVGKYLRSTFFRQLNGSAPRLNLSVPSGATKVAFDSKLWIQWEQVSTETTKMERKMEFTLPVQTLEASYKALVLGEFLGETTDRVYQYRVSPESADTKLDEGGAYYVLGKTDEPGWMFKTANSLGLRKDDKYKTTNFRALYSIIRVEIVRFDRLTLTAEIRLLPRTPEEGITEVIHDLTATGILPLSGNWFLMENTPVKSKEVEKILKSMGNPSIASADPAALRAMGVKQPPAKGKDPVTPAALVLWEAQKLAATAVRTPGQGTELAARARCFSGNALDFSQEQAIGQIAQQQLSLVWGPPGTGKTSTLTAYLLAVIEEAKEKPINILLTGPNYRAVEVLFYKLLGQMNKFSELQADLWMVYSRSRAVVELPEQPELHFNARAVKLDAELAIPDLQASFHANRVSVFATSAHTAVKLAKELAANDNDLNEVFDLVIIDESSQVPLTLALNPLATLKHGAQLVIAGDPMQMPPIHSLEPPLGAEHLVGSIHTYLKKRFDIPEQALLVNYRSAGDLVFYARTLGYPRGLQAKFPDRRLQLLQPFSAVTLPGDLPKSEAWAEVLAPDRVVTAILHDDVQSSQANPAEARMVAALAYLLRHGVAQQLSPPEADHVPVAFTDEEFLRSGLGVVTPHKAQRTLVMAELRKLFPAVSDEVLRDGVDTVERFQGGQRHTIIVSFGVGDVDIIQGEEEFLLQMERANVAISRAMGKCIVIMPKSLAYHLPADSKIAKTAAALKSYMEEFCENRAVFSSPAFPKLEIRWRTSLC